LNSADVLGHLLRIFDEIGISDERDRIPVAVPFLVAAIALELFGESFERDKLGRFVLLRFSADAAVPLDARPRDNVASAYDDRAAFLA